MSDKQTAALKLALEALEVSRNTLDASRNWLQRRHDVTHDLAITAIREALAEQPQEPKTFDPNESFAREEAAQARVREFMRNH